MTLLTHYIAGIPFDTINAADLLAANDEAIKRVMLEQARAARYLEEAAPLEEKTHELES